MTLVYIITYIKSFNSNSLVLDYKQSKKFISLACIFNCWWIRIILCFKEFWIGNFFTILVFLKAFVNNFAIYFAPISYFLIIKIWNPKKITKLEIDIMKILETYLYLSSSYWGYTRRKFGLLNFLFRCQWLNKTNT